MTKITIEELQQFQLKYFQHRTELRYGQAFCNKYNITDSVLFYETNHTKATDYIIEHYVEIK